MEVRIISDEEAFSQCAWCRNQISDDIEVFGFGAKIRPDADLSDYAGQAIQLMIVSEDKTVPMMVTSPQLVFRKRLPFYLTRTGFSAARFACRSKTSRLSCAIGNARFLIKEKDYDSSMWR